MSTEGFDYPHMMREALREVARQALEQVAESGLPGAHHFYLSFRTDRPGVEIPASLRERYREEMTVVLQHQWWDLEVDREAFSVGLTFGGSPQRIRVPFSALTAFIDPAAEFGLRFDGARGDEEEDRPRGPQAVEDQEDGDAAPEAVPALRLEKEGPGGEGTETAGDEGEEKGEEEGSETPADVVSIDRFRKK